MTAKPVAPVAEQVAAAPEHVGELDPVSSATTDDHFSDIAAHIPATLEPEEHYEEHADDLAEPEEVTSEKSTAFSDTEPAGIPPSNDETPEEVPHIEHQTGETTIDDNVADNAPVEPHVMSDAEEDVHALPESPTPVKSGDNLEDVVTMLESGMPAPIKLSMPDDSLVAGEIPDEE